MSRRSVRGISVIGRGRGRERERKRGSSGEVERNVLEGSGRGRGRRWFRLFRGGGWIDSEVRRRRKRDLLRLEWRFRRGRRSK